MILNKYVPSIIALACVIWARKINKIDKEWNECLQEISGYSYKLIESAYEILYQFYLNTYNMMKQKQRGTEDVENNQENLHPNFGTNLKLNNQLTARNNNNKLLIPDLNLKKINQNNAFRRSGSTHNGVKSMVIKLYFNL